MSGALIEKMRTPDTDGRKRVVIEGVKPEVNGGRFAAKRVVGVMDALGLDDVDLIAHSHGGAIALMIAALYPKRVRRLILFAPANPYSRSSDLMVRVYSTPWGGALAWMLPYLPAPIQRMALGEIYGGTDRVMDSCLQEIVNGLRSPGTLRHVLCVIRCWFAEMAKLRTALRRVRRIPTLLVWGDRDCTVSLSSGSKLKRKLRSAKLMVVPGGGHSVFEEKPELANRIMLRWLERHPLAAPQARGVVPRRNRVVAAAMQQGSPEMMQQASSHS